MNDGSEPNPEIVMEDNSVQLLRDSDSTSSSSSSAKAIQGLAMFHGWAYKHYFHVVSKDSKNLWVCCTLCGGRKTLSSTRNTNSYFFRKHLNTVHKSVNLIAKEVEKPERKWQRSGMDTDDSEPKRQCTLTRNSIPAQKM